MSADYQPWGADAHDPFVYRWVNAGRPRIARYMPGAGHHGCDVQCAWIDPGHPDYERAKRAANAEKALHQQISAAMPVYTVHAPTHTPIPNCPQDDQGNAGES